MTSQLLNEILTPEESPIIDYREIITEDDTPVDNFQSEKQQRLLVEPLYSTWVTERPFIAAANVGIFYALKQNPIVPDAFLSLDVDVPHDWSLKQNRTYFVWEIGKVPEVAVEIVSNRKGDELGNKKSTYARMGVAYYVVLDPLQQLQREDELNGSLLKVWVLNAKNYVELTEPFWLESIGLGLTLWEGQFEGQQDVWLRWCDRQGQVIPTGAEGRDMERQRAEAEAQRAEAEAQRAEAEAQRAEAEAQRAKAEAQRAEAERQRADRLAERLRALGIDPDVE